MFGRGYSTLVNGLKVTLPLVALGLLATLFLFSEAPDPDRALPYAEVDLDELARELRFTQPRFAGVLEDGREVTLVAGTAAPEFDQTGDSRAIEFQDLDGRIALSETDVLTLSAPTGRIDIARQVAHMSGGVTAQTTLGYSIQSQEMQVQLNQLGLISDSPVDISTPELSLTAGTMSITGATGAEVLSFTGGVRLLYGQQQ